MQVDLFDAITSRLDLLSVEVDESSFHLPPEFLAVCLACGYGCGVFLLKMSLTKSPGGHLPEKATIGAFICVHLILQESLDIFLKHMHFMRKKSSFHSPFPYWGLPINPQVLARTPPPRNPPDQNENQHKLFEIYIHTISTRHSI